MTRSPTPAEFYTSELDKVRKAWEAGHLPALNDALQLCHLWQIPLPEWAVIALMTLVRDRFFAADKGTKKTRATRHDTPKSRYVRRVIELHRWQAVTNQLFVLAKGKKVDLKAGRPKRGEASLARALLGAHEALKGSIAQGEPREIRKAFKAVENAKAEGKNTYTFSYSVPAFRQINPIGPK